MRTIRRRLLALAVIASVAGLGSFALGEWLSFNQTFGSFSSSSDVTSATPQGPSTWTIILESLLTIVGVMLVAVAVVAVAGLVASLVVDDARRTEPDLPEPPPFAAPVEVVENGS